METELLIVGLIFFATAFGHAAVGLRWVLRDVAKQPLSGTPFGPTAMTHGMLRVTWHLVTLILLAFGILLTTLASAPAIDPKILLLRWFAVLLLAATALMVWSARDHLSSLLRLPVPALMIIMAAMCWKAAG